MKKLAKILIGVLAFTSCYLNILGPVKVPIAHASLSQILPLSQTTLSTDANLVSYWPLNGNSNDTKGSNSGTDTSMSYSASSPPNANFGQHAVFNGTTSQIEKTTAVGMGSGANAFTYMGLMQTSVTGTRTMVNYGNFSTCNSRGIIVLSGTPGKLYFAGQSCDVGPGATSLTDGTWHYIAVTFDGTTVKIYVDGSSDATSGTPALNITGTKFRLGNDNSVAQNAFFSGNLIDWSFFSRALSATEISNHWTGADALPSGNAMFFGGD